MPISRRHHVYISHANITQNIFSLQTRMIFIYEAARLFSVRRIYCKKISRAKIPFCIFGPSSLLADVFKLHFSSLFFPFSPLRILAIFSRHFFPSWSFSTQKIVPVLKLSLPGQDRTPKMDKANGKDKTMLKYSVQRDYVKMFVAVIFFSTQE